MALDEGLSRFLGELYEAVHEPQAWRSAMGEVIRRSDSRMAVVTTVDLRRKDVVDIQFHGPEDSAIETGVREYVGGMSVVDPVFNWMQHHPSAGNCTSAMVVPKYKYQDHEFIKWSGSRFGSIHWSVFYTPPVDDLSFVVSFFVPAGAEGPSKRQSAVQALLFENLERAIRLAARPPNFAADDSALIAIDSRGRPLSFSQRAEELLRTANCLTIRDGLLMTDDPETTLRLHAAIRAAVDPTSDALRGRGVRLSCNGGNCEQLAIVSRFPPSLDHLPGAVPAALVRLVELEMRADHLSEHSHLFDFSARETEIASALLEGHSIESLSALLGVSRNTVRNHLQSLFRKTDTNRQIDLMRVLDRLARQ